MPPTHQLAQITNQTVNQPDDGFALLTQFKYEVGVGELRITALTVGPTETPTTQLAVFYDGEWANVSANSSCAAKVAQARKVWPVQDIIDVMQTPVYNGTWLLMVSDRFAAHTWFVVAANCAQGKLTSFQWSAVLTGPPGNTTTATETAAATVTATTTASKSVSLRAELWLVVAALVGLHGCH